MVSTNLQNVLKLDLLVPNTGSSVDENSALNGFNSCDDAAVLLAFMITKNLPIIKQNVAVPVTSSSP